MNKNFKSHKMTIESMEACSCSAICSCSCGCGMDPFIVNTQFAQLHEKSYTVIYDDAKSRGEAAK